MMFHYAKDVVIYIFQYHKKKWLREGQGIMCIASSSRSIINEILQNGWMLAIVANLRNNNGIKIVFGVPFFLYIDKNG